MAEQTLSHRFQRTVQSLCCPLPEKSISSSYAFIAYFVLIAIITLFFADRWTIPTLQGNFDGRRNLDHDLTIRQGVGMQCSTCGPPTTEDGQADDFNAKCLSECIDLDDVEFGFITGPAFAIPTLVFSIPMGFLADRFSRVRILLLGLCVWSAAMVMSGFVQNFWQLLVCCLLLGVGQETVNPTVYSLLADYFSSKYRSTILSIAAAMVFPGQDLSYVGGILAQYWTWRGVFYLFGGAGLALAIPSFFVLREPLRGLQENAEHQRKDVSSNLRDSILPPKETPHIGLKHEWELFKQSFRVCLTTHAFYWLWVSAGLRFMAGFALGAWSYTFYRRVFGLEPTTISVGMTIVVTVGGLSGSVIGPLIADIWKKRDVGANAWCCAISGLFGAPFTGFAFVVSNFYASFSFLLVGYFFAETWFGPAVAIAQDIIPIKYRSFATSLYFLSTTLGGLAPLLVGWLNEAIQLQAPYTEAVSGSDIIVLDPTYSMLIVIPGGYLLSVVTFCITGWVMRHGAVAGVEAGNGVQPQQEA